MKTTVLSSLMAGFAADVLFEAVALDVGNDVTNVVAVDKPLED